MTDAELPAAMVFAALGLMLGLFSHRIMIMGVTSVLSAAICASVTMTSLRLSNTAVLSCWVMIATISIFVYWPRYALVAVVAAVSIVAGIVVGVALPATGYASNLAQSSLSLLIIAPASAATARGYSVALRVVMSWLLAVSLLAAILPFAVSHPGYVADHRG